MKIGVIGAGRLGLTFALLCDDILWLIAKDLTSELINEINKEPTVGMKITYNDRDNIYNTIIVYDYIIYLLVGPLN